MTSTGAVLPASVRDRLEHLIGGRWVGSSSTERISVVSPSTELPVAHVVQGTVAEADRAVRAAHEAWPLWAARPVGERIALVRALHDAIGNLQAADPARAGHGGGGRLFLQYGE